MYLTRNGSGVVGTHPGDLRRVNLGISSDVHGRRRKRTKRYNPRGRNAGGILEKTAMRPQEGGSANSFRPANHRAN
eukprot:scaffold96583_cov35-Tisochrysis_lutea.AAC.3